MQVVNIHQAKTHLSRLLEAVQSGEDMVIAKAGAPIVRLTSYAPPSPSIAPPGAMEGEGWIADDFDDPIDDMFDCLNPDIS